MDSMDLCTTPSAPSPNGVYNFVNPPSLGPAVIAVGVVLCVVSTAFSAGRLYINRNKMHPADYFTLVACLINIAYTGVICAQHRSYRHQWDIPVCWYTGHTFKLLFVQTILFAPAFFFPKAAIFLLYRQLFAPKKGTRVAINIGLVITLLIYLSQIPLAAIYSAPRAGHSWNSLLLTIVNNSRPFALGGAIQSAIGTVMDFYIFFLPLPILIHLQMPVKRRVQLVCIFSTALFGMGASVLSLVFKIEIVNGGDSGWLAGITSMTSLIETNIALIVGCMPALARLATNTVSGTGFFRSLRSWLHRSTLHSAKSKSNSPGNSGNLGKQPSRVTIGATQRPRKNYYELRDTALLQSQGSTIMADSIEEGRHDLHSKPSSTHDEAYQV